jgi:putative endonuclease
LQYVYLLQSILHPTQRYTGLTSDIQARLAKHNEGGVPHTAKFKPWQLVTYTAFQTRKQAGEYECYLKSGSGRAFANKHLWAS